MPWSKIDDGWYDHPKVVAAGTLGAGLFVLALSYCARQLTDGFVPPMMVKRLCPDVDDPIKLAEHLIDTGLFQQVDGGYLIHDYLKYNPSRAQVLRERAEAQERMRRIREQQGNEEERSEELPPNKEERSGEPQRTFKAPGPVPSPSPDSEPLPPSEPPSQSVPAPASEETDRPTDSGDGEMNKDLPASEKLESEVRYAISQFEPGREDASLIMRAYKLWDSTLHDGQRMREDDFLITMSRARGATLARRNANGLNTTHAMEYYMACLENTLKAMATIQAEGP